MRPLRIAVAAVMAASAVAAPVVAQEPSPPPADVAQQPAPPPSAPEASPAPESVAPPAAAPAAGEAVQPAGDAAPSGAEAQPSASPSPAVAPSTSAAEANEPAASPDELPPFSADPSAEPAVSDGPGSPDAAAPSPGEAAAEESKVPHLPHDLSPWGMFMQADIVVKAVMIGLAFASVVTWTVWLAKSLELSWAKRRLTRAFSRIHSASTLAEAAQRLQGQKGIVLGLIEHAALELSLSADVSDKDGIKERVASRLEGLASAAGRDMNRGTGVLATIGSTAPFVGLFGTVWGIMNSFIGISEAQTTNLAVVAPGIAEALLATAIGLVAAIPAVIIYNHFARQIGGYRAMIAEAAAEVQRLVSRDLDRGLKIARARAAE